jgi:hypothetical protein
VCERSVIPWADEPRLPPTSTLVRGPTRDGVAWSRVVHTDGILPAYLMMETRTHRSSNTPKRAAPSSMFAKPSGYQARPAAIELVRLAKERGLSLTGPDGLLKQLTETSSRRLGTKRSPSTWAMRKTMSGVADSRPHESCRSDEGSVTQTGQSAPTPTRPWLG